MNESLVRQMHWANAQIIAWLGNPSGAIPKDSEGISGDNSPDTSGVLGHLSHILRAERIWLDRVHGHPPSERNTFAPYFRNQLPCLNDANRDDWLAQVRQGSLDRQVAYLMFDGSSASSTVQDMLLHVITHGFHHRGQIASRIAALRFPQPPTAYISYSRLLK